MCEFCVKHGQGRKWYLEANNYSLDLIRDRRKFGKLMDWLDGGTAGDRSRLDRLKRWLSMPIIGSVFGKLITWRMKPRHFGQVIPLEEAEKVFALADVVCAVPCICRRQLHGRQDERCCFALGNFAREFFLDSPDIDPGAEELTVDEACRRAAAAEEDGLIHTIWTLQTPFIVGICSCRPGDCLAMELTGTRKTQIMFKAESVAVIDADACVGCRKCAEACYFDALAPADDAGKKYRVRADHCHGCGLCRRSCPTQAISLTERHPEPQPTTLRALA